MLTILIYWVNMVSDITNNLKTALAGLSTYGGTPIVELERLLLIINDRYPYIQLCGPYSEVETQIHKVAETRLDYIIKYFINYNDESETLNTEITYVTRNVCGDIIKQIMIDPTRGEYAIITKYTDYGYIFEIMEDNIEFYRYIFLEITTRIDANDPYLIG